MSLGWYFFCVAVLAATALLLVALARFWGREVGTVGYVYWLSAAALPLVGIVVLSLAVAQR